MYDCRIRYLHCLTAQGLEDITGDLAYNIKVGTVEKMFPGIQDAESLVEIQRESIISLGSQI